MGADRGWLDPYERRAQLLPALVAVLPLLFLGAAVGIREHWFPVALIGIGSAAGGPVIVAALVRERGRRLQGELWTRWGGPPTTLLLQDDPRSTSPQRQARRRRVERIGGEPLPTATEETEAPQTAAERYETAVAEARRVTRTSEAQRVVQAENVAYGTARNLLSLKPLGLACALLALGGATAAAILAMLYEVPYGVLEPTFAGLGSTGLLLFWNRYPTEARVRSAGERYAGQLLDAVPLTDWNR